MRRAAARQQRHSSPAPGTAAWRGDGAAARKTRTTRPPRRGRAVVRLERRRGGIIRRAAAATRPAHRGRRARMAARCRGARRRRQTARARRDRRRLTSVAAQANPATAFARSHSSAAAHVRLPRARAAACRPAAAPSVGAEVHGAAGAVPDERPQRGTRDADPVHVRPAARRTCRERRSRAPRARRSRCAVSAFAPQASWNPRGPGRASPRSGLRGAGLEGVRGERPTPCRHAAAPRARPAAPPPGAASRWAARRAVAPGGRA